MAPSCVQVLFEMLLLPGSSFFWPNHQEVTLTGAIQIPFLHRRFVFPSCGFTTFAPLYVFPATCSTCVCLCACVHVCVCDMLFCTRKPRKEAAPCNRSAGCCCCSLSLTGRFRLLQYQPASETCWRSWTAPGPVKSALRLGNKSTKKVKGKKMLKRCQARALWKTTNR